MRLASEKPNNEEEIVFQFKPAQEGEYISGVPARDLTVADLNAIHPLSLRDALAPGPSGKPMYVKLESSKAMLTKEQEAAIKVASAPTAPATAAPDAATAPEEEG